MSELPTRLRRAVRGLVEALPPPRDEAALDVLRAARDLVRGRPPASSTDSEPTTGGLAAWRRGLREAAERDPQRFHALVDELHEATVLAEHLAKPDHIPDDERLATGRGVSSTQYTIDLLPHLQSDFERHARWSSLSLLDVGPGTGHGAALLTTLYETPRLGYRLDVTALDVVDSYRRYLHVIAPSVRFVHEDLFDHDEHYDYVVASHVIEHVPDPTRLCRRMQEVAREAVHLVAPFDEPADALTKGHVRVVDDDTMQQLGAEDYTVYESRAWGAFMQPPYRSVIARLPGLAGGTE